jgi:peptidyl-prolyl cis-trans isomerase C
MYYFLITILTVTLFWSSAFGASSSLVAKVGPYTLTKQDLQKMLKNDPQIRKILKIRPDLKPKIENMIIKKWISVSLLALGAKEEGLEKNPQVKKDIQEAIKLVLADHYLKEKIANIKPTEKDLRLYYASHKEEYKRPEKAIVKHIFISFPENATQTQKEEAFKKALSVRKKLLNGAKFETIAKKYSSSGNKGDTTGYITKGDLPEDIEKEIFSLRPGEISKPIESRYGYYIVKLEKKIPAYTPPFDKIKDQIKKAYVREKEKEVLQKILKGLSEKYEVKIYRSF